MHRILAIFISALLFLAPISVIHAFEKQTFITVVNPVTGSEGWTFGSAQTPLDLPNFQYKEATKSGMPITWLLRFDVVSDATLSAKFKTLAVIDKTQEIGAYLEVTPMLTTAAGVNYPEGDHLHQPHRIFLSGYSQSDRIKLIDTYMDKFRATYGYYPKSVGAWYIDSYSLSYLADKYQAAAAVICDEQYSTDAYRIWGSYLGSPYFPSKFNTLVPASSFENRINIAIVKWAKRDPYNFYGYRGSSSYSVQVNDYISYGLSTSYFDKLLGIFSKGIYNDFSQVVIGLENGYPINEFKQEVANTYHLLSERKSAYNLKFVKLSEFGNWLKTFYPESSPSFLYQADDSTGREDGQVIWYQNPFYRLGLKNINNETRIIDFRIFHQDEGEPYYLSPNQTKILYAETSFIVDSVKFPGSEIVLPFNISKVDTKENSWIVTLTDGEKSITLKPQQVIYSGFAAPEINSSEIKVTDSRHGTVWEIRPQIPFSLDTKSIVTLLFLGLLSLTLLFVCIGIKRESLSLLVTGALVVFLALATVIKSGLIFPFGMGFWGPNGHDAIFHLSLISSFRDSLFNLGNPMLAGLKLQNYHLGFDFLGAVLSLLFGLSALDTYFRLLPVVLICLIIALLVKLLRLWNYSTGAISLSILGVFLTGSLGFIPKIISGGEFFSGESVFWANQSISILLNPPFALSLVFLLLFLVKLETSKTKLTFTNLLLLGFIGGILAQIKVYAFILLLLALLIKKQFKLTLITGIFGSFFILPSLGGSGFPFTLSPFWFTRSMFASPDRLNWEQLVQAWQVYEIKGQFVKLFLVNLFAVLVFIFGNLGVRLLGAFKLFDRSGTFLTKKIISVLTIIGVLIPLVFVQNVNPWNTIQFIYYSAFFLSLFASEVIFSIIKKVNLPLRLLSLSLLATVSLPTTIGTLRDYVTPTSASNISFNELRALDKLRLEPPGTVISPIYGTFPIGNLVHPRPLYAYVSTGYISAFSGHPEYLGDTINLDITGYSYQDRKNLNQRLYNTHDSIWAKRFLAENNISYVYEVYLNPLKVSPESICLTKIFDSGEINLYKFTCHD